MNSAMAIVQPIALIWSDSPKPKSDYWAVGLMDSPQRRSTMVNVILHKYTLGNNNNDFSAIFAELRQCKFYV